MAQEETNGSHLCIRFYLHLYKLNLYIDFIEWSDTLVVDGWVTLHRFWLYDRGLIHLRNQSCLLRLEDSLASIILVCSKHVKVEWTFVLALSLNHCYIYSKCLFKSTAALPNHAIQLDLVREHDCVVEDWWAWLLPHIARFYTWVDVLKRYLGHIRLFNCHSFSWAPWCHWRFSFLERFLGRRKCVIWVLALR